MECYAGASLVPEADSEEAQPIHDKRNELSSLSVEIVNNLSVEEVLDMYEVREVARTRVTEITTKVPFPLHPSVELDKEQSEHWTSIIDWNIKDGGAVVGDP